MFFFFFLKPSVITNSELTSQIWMNKGAICYITAQQLLPLGTPTFAQSVEFLAAGQSIMFPKPPPVFCEDPQKNVMRKLLEDAYDAAMDMNTHFEVLEVPRCVAALLQCHPHFISFALIAIQMVLTPNGSQKLIDMVSRVVSKRTHTYRTSVRFPFSTYEYVDDIDARLLEPCMDANRRVRLGALLSVAFEHLEKLALQAGRYDKTTRGLSRDPVFLHFSKKGYCRTLTAEPSLSSGQHEHTPRNISLHARCLARRARKHVLREPLQEVALQHRSSLKTIVSRLDEH